MGRNTRNRTNMENMVQNGGSAASFVDTKPHYELLDGLRGVAALLVIWYHVHEGFAFAGGGLITGINHGYLAVDFFFMLSGFVISYAYDDRWAKGMGLKDFFRRRLIRLHPMVLLGAVTGAVTFLIQGSVRWDGSHVGLSAVMLAILCAMFMIPAVPGCRYEVRGNGEMFPLDGPGWSLFFEYIGNIIYALIIRRVGTRALAVLTVILGMAYTGFAVADVSGYGSMGVGWTADSVNLAGGLIRMMFPFTAGMLIARNFRPAKVRWAFVICSAVLAALFCVPYLGQTCTAGGVKLTLNGAFEAFCVVAVFPVLVWMGAAGSIGGNVSTKICRFLGDISFPLYITHYPFMYLFYSWMISTGRHTLSETWPVAAVLCVWCVLFAWLSLKLYDVPVRNILSRKFRKKTS